jgi:hypothetical protein
LIQHEEDHISDSLESMMRYVAMIGWMAFNQMAMMNTRIPLYGDGNYEQLQGDVVDHDECLEMLERRYTGVDKELNQISDGTYHWVTELEERVEQLEGMVAELRLGLHRSLVELVRLQAVVNTNNHHLASIIHRRDNPIVVDNLLEPGPLRLPQLPEGHPHQLVPIEDLGSEEELEGERSVFDEDAEVQETAVMSRASSPEL